MFETLLGQDTVKKTLGDAAAAGRPGHAYVFCGPEGSGRKSFAAEFARAVMCREPGEGGEPCGKCVSCRLMEAGTNPDFIPVTGDVTKNSVGIDAVRMLGEDVMTAPEYGARKVYIIDRAEKLTLQAQNALLKTVEEPPEYVTVIFICANPDALIDTVRSRTVRLDFARNTDAEILQALRSKGKEYSREEEQMITAYADGIIGRAVDFSDPGSFGKLREGVFDALGLLEGRTSGFVLGFGRLFSDNQDEKEFLFFVLSSALRDLMVYARFGENVSLQNVQYGGKIKHLSGLFDAYVWEEMLGSVNKAWRAAGRNVNYKLLTDNLAAELGKLAAGAGKKR